MPGRHLLARNRKGELEIRKERRFDFEFERYKNGTEKAPQMYAKGSSRSPRRTRQRLPLNSNENQPGLTGSTWIALMISST